MRNNEIMRRWAPIVACGLVLACFAGRALALPDITPELFDVAVHNNRAVDPGDVVEGCAGGSSGRKLIDFSLRTRSLGPDDLFLGVPGCPDCSTHPNAACSNNQFVCSPAHGHPHFNSFSKAELIDGNGTVIAIGRKQGFCLLDLECGVPKYSCGNQGISAGCSDVYSSGLPCQYIDITDSNVPDGDYTLRVTLDPENVIAEGNESNNVTTASVHVGATPPPPITCRVIAASDLPKAIPDVASVTSTLTSTLGGVVQRARIVELRGTHTYSSDLEFHLIDPQGTDVDVLHRQCGDSDNFHLDLADNGDASLVCPMTTGLAYQPANALSAVNGHLAAGTWSLTVYDRAPQDVGSLDGWGLEICTSCGNGTLDQGEVCDDGNTADGDCCASDCRSIASNGTPCGVPTQCLVGTCTAGVCNGQLSCDPCLTCNPGVGCEPPSAALCDGMLEAKSMVTMKRHPSDDGRNMLSWNWTNGSPVALLDFGNPLAVTDLSLCVYDQRGLQYSLTAPAAGTCPLSPCWMSTTLGYRYKDPDYTPDGIGRMTLIPGIAHRARVQLRGRGANMGFGDLALQTPVTVRLQRSGGPACWEGTYASPARSDAYTFKAKHQ